MRVAFLSRRRRRRRNTTLLFILGCAAVVILYPSFSFADEPRTCTPSSSSVYEWDSYNYYQILDLEPTDPSNAASPTKRRQERDALTASDVRRNYRRQAQLYHPDKVSKNQTINVEERTGRFARIAEAYEILSNETKRREYDAFLMDCEDHLSGGFDEVGSWSSVLDNMATDPRRVFEEFFFGPSSSELAWDDYMRYNGAGQSHHGGKSSPIRVYETRDVHRDPYTGSEMMRILQTEEFEANAEGQLYYRVTAQDFVKEFDPVHGWNYVPVSQPFLLEEGYTHDSPHPSSSKNTLSPGEFLTPESPALRASNGRYVAGLSNTCELLIMTGERDEGNVVWSSGSYVPPSHMYNADGCFLGLHGPHLVLVLGAPDKPGAVLWYSDVADSVIEEEEYLIATGGPASLYVARLDDDGRLAVYRHETTRRADDASSGSKNSWWSLFLGQEGSPPSPRTRAARAWSNVQTWIRRRVAHHRTQGMFPRETCIYATGPAGCNRPIRKIFHIALDVGHSVKYTMIKIDDAIDTFVESITEKEDEDFFDTAFRVANMASSGLLRVAHSLLRVQASFLHKVFRSMKRFFSAVN